MWPWCRDLTPADGEAGSGTRPQRAGIGEHRGDLVGKIPAHVQTEVGRPLAGQFARLGADRARPARAGRLRCELQGRRSCRHLRLQYEQTEQVGRKLRLNRKLTNAQADSLTDAFVRFRELRCAGCGCSGFRAARRSARRLCAAATSSRFSLIGTLASGLASARRSHGTSSCKPLRRAASGVSMTDHQDFLREKRRAGRTSMQVAHAQQQIVVSRRHGAGAITPQREAAPARGG